MHGTERVNIIFLLQKMIQGSISLATTFQDLLALYRRAIDVV